nr:putative DNA-mediated transposase [Haemonchus contortus]
MDDNARPHRTAQVEELLAQEDIRRMEWPARSPDLNPIEHVWDALGRRIAARPNAPVTIQQLSIALKEEWNALPQELITNLVESMGSRCRACIAVRGDHTPY